MRASFATPGVWRFFNTVVLIFIEVREVKLCKVPPEVVSASCLRLEQDLSCDCEVHCTAELRDTRACCHSVSKKKMDDPQGLDHDRMASYVCKDPPDTSHAIALIHDPE